MEVQSFLHFTSCNPLFTTKRTVLDWDAFPARKNGDYVSAALASVWKSRQQWWRVTWEQPSRRDVPLLHSALYYFTSAFVAYTSLNRTTKWSSAECSRRRQFGQWHVSTMCFIVCGWPYEHLLFCPDDAIHHSCELATRWPCPVWNWFRTDHNCRDRSKVLVGWLCLTLSSGGRTHLLVTVHHLILIVQLQ